MPSIEFDASDKSIWQEQACELVRAAVLVEQAAYSLAGTIDKAQIASLILAAATIEKVAGGLHQQSLGSRVPEPGVTLPLQPAPDSTRSSA